MRLRFVRAWLALAPVLLLAGCSGRAPSTLDPAGPGARRVASLWWLLFWISAGVFAVFLVVLVWAVARRHRSGSIRRGDATRFVVVTGAVVPFVILTGVYAVGLRDMSALRAPEHPAAAAAAPGTVTVEVTGHQWWWEVRYPGTAATTANEIHVPVGTPVQVRLTTDDVLHSFWVPQLMPKTDLIAGQVNTTWITAEEPGTYRGMCAEYCGLQHRYMHFVVVAEPRAAFDAWVAHVASPAPSPDTAAEQRGMQVFLQTGCAACHTVRGTPADGTVGPDLTTVGDRWSLGAGAAPNNTGALGGWVANSQQVKPGNAMPPQPVPAEALPDLVAYLRSLK
ncbi:cytochrome c oxidase subunit II [Amycolatopsis thermoflava]|uniref:cytochrome c oxidase subunit II n=1 Tax=Amycolatopsis thermoflava TaxID=84480 RepID=UPI003EC08004